MSRSRLAVRGVTTGGQASPCNDTHAHPNRRPDLDWLRVLAVLLLAPVHGANIFNQDPVIVAYVKDTSQLDFLIQLKDLFFSRWRLETLFLIAGAVSWHALAKRSSGQYVVERVKRLLVPFVFSLVAIFPLLVNARWLGRPGAPTLGAMYERFFIEAPTDLTGMDGHFTPSHLWFVLFLLLFSLVGVPLFQVLRRPSAQQAVDWALKWPVTIYLFVVPLTLVRQANLVGLDDKDPLYFFLIFTFGYITVSQPRFQAAVDRYLPVSVAIAVAVTVASVVSFPRHPAPGTTDELAVLWLFRISQWTWVLAALGAGHRWLHRDGPVLRYASQAVYPFYILHLPLATLVACLVVRTSLPAGLKYTIIVIAAVGLSLALYEGVVKRVNVLRVCFGLPALKAVAPAESKRRSSGDASAAPSRGWGKRS
jgi:peptidoglycan/LPS O-acetylase OafA/YrhL